MSFASHVVSLSNGLFIFINGKRLSYDTFCILYLTSNFEKLNQEMQLKQSTATVLAVLPCPKA